MKNRLLVCASLFLLAGTTINAQNSNENDREEFQFGFKIGLNNSNVWDEQGQDFEADSKLGFMGGIFFGIPMGKVVGFQPEILLSQKGFQGSGTLLATPYSFSRTTTYLDIPLQLQIKPSDFLTIVVGPQYSYLLKQKDVYTFGVNSTEQEKEFNNDNVRKNIAGFVTGADFIYSNLVISGRFGWDFQTNNGDGTSSTPRYKNQWLQFSIGYKI